MLIESDNPGIHITNPKNPLEPKCESTVSCWKGTYYLDGVFLQTDETLKPGTYIIRVSGRGFGRQHEARVPVIVDADLTARKRQRAEALALLLREDPVPAPTPAITPTEPPNELHPSVVFSADVALRKIHAVLVLDHSGSMWGSCDFMRGASKRFSQLFADQRDSLAVIAYNENAQLLLPLTDHFQPDASARILKLTCTGSTNTAEALQLAQRELSSSADPEAIHVLILFTDGGWGSLSARWPVKARCDERTGSCSPQETACREIQQQEGPIPAVLQPTFSRPNEIFGFVFGPHLEPAAAGTSAAAPDPKLRTKMSTCLPAFSTAPFAFLPEEDYWGTSFTGSRPLGRLEGGTDAGRIRLDVGNIVRAGDNQMDNVARRLKASVPAPTYIYVIGFPSGKAAAEMESLDYFRQLTNDPASSLFDRDRPAGLTIVTEKPEDFWPAFQRVRQEIVTHATVK